MTERNFYELSSYSFYDIESLIKNEVEENIHLDYKRAEALGKDSKCVNEISKDVSAFANSDGGIIIYGLSEENHKPKDFSFIDGCIYTKEWLETKILDNIHQRINGIIIYPIRKDGDLKKTVYVVKIPRSGSAPHMAIDHRYYRRFNFESVPMDEYEVRDLFYRKNTPDLVITGCWFAIIGEKGDKALYELSVSIYNRGHCECDSYKVNVYLNEIRYCNFSYKPLEEQHSFTIIDKNRLKFGSPSKESIFQDEHLDIGHFGIEVLKEKEECFINNLVIDMILLFPGGKDELAYVPSTKEFIEDRDEINIRISEKTSNYD